MVARRVDVNLYVCNPIAFAKPVHRITSWLDQPYFFASPEVRDFPWVSHWDYREEGPNWSYLEKAKAAGQAGFVLAGNQQTNALPHSRWRSVGYITSDYGGAAHSVHLVGPGQAIQTAADGLSFTTLADTADPYVSVESCLQAMRGMLMGPLGNDIGIGGQIVIDGSGYTVENPSQLLGEYSMTIMGLVQQMSESVEVEVVPPSVLTTNGRSPSEKIHEYDLNASATLSLAEGVVGYVADGSGIFKSPEQRKAAVAVVYAWLHDKAVGLRLAMLRAASDGNPVPPEELQLLPRPVEMTWLTQEELDDVEKYIESLQRLRLEGNSNVASAAESLQDAYDRYVASVPEGETVLSKSDWVNQLIETANAADGGLDNKAWYESIWDAIKGFGSSTLEFIEDNPGLAAGVGGVIGVETGLIEPWMLVAGAVVLLLLLN